jgi:hypothetical protein
MAHEHSKPLQDDPIRAEACALAASIQVIRRAQGKSNPEDFFPESPECIEAMEDFMRDVGQILKLDKRGVAVDDDSELHGAGSTG